MAPLMLLSLTMHCSHSKRPQFCCAQMVLASETSLAGVITNAYGPDKLSIKPSGVLHEYTISWGLMHLDAGVLRSW